MKFSSVILLLAVLALPLQSQKPSTTPSLDQGRYQLVLMSSQQLFLLDSQTGRVWHYRPESQLSQASGPPQTQLEAFLPVMIQSGGGMKVTPDPLQ